MKIWPYIGDVDGVLEELELNFDEFKPGWRDDGADWVIVRHPGSGNYRYTGTVLTVNRKGLRRLFPPRSPADIDITKMAPTYGMLLRWIDEDTFEIFVHPEAEHHKPASAAQVEEMKERLAELHLKKRQDERRGGPGIEVEEAPAGIGAIRGKARGNPRRR
jgi:hypothetical protein